MVRWTRLLPRSDAPVGEHLGTGIPIDADFLAARARLTGQSPEPTPSLMAPDALGPLPPPIAAALASGTQRWWVQVQPTSPLARGMLWLAGDLAASWRHLALPPGAMPAGSDRVTRIGDERWWSLPIPPAAWPCCRVDVVGDQGPLLRLALPGRHHTLVALLVPTLARGAVRFDPAPHGGAHLLCSDDAPRRLVGLQPVLTAVAAATGIVLRLQLSWLGRPLLTVRALVEPR